MQKYSKVLLILILFLLGTQATFAGRYYDSKTGRFLQIDPKAHKYPGWSPYNYALNNPLKYIDPDGKEVYVKSNGYINKDIPIKSTSDPRVYLVMNGKQSLIGALGGKINANVIFNNLLGENISKSKELLSPFTFKSLVQNKGEWDLKNNDNTIFGIANKKENAGTSFSFNKYEMESQDIGNFHYGAVGKAYGFFSEWFLEEQAGEAQIKSGTSKKEWQNGFLTPFTWPYGDDPRDNYYIKRGFEYYDTSKKQDKN